MLEHFREKSPWVYHMNTGSCNGCDIEIMALFSSKYDVERLGIKMVGSPRHADILLLTGPVTARSKEPLLKVYEMIPDPKVVVAIGCCAISGGVFNGGYSIVGPADKFIPVDVYIGGCSAHPNAIIEGLMKAIKIFKELRKE
ncbi:Ech-type complex subunit Ech2C [Thermoanaerobacter kivui]|uniref:Ech-type complex subunit Ech2C n=1 Tax=Thermoanaerobacter kivui TaxID=2325 RepID=A0A097ATJ2_THEKI|nr:NADH-quinone oxidoreductase subunit B family protein [Thermoanaerobacter kivui]AIS53114.1 Ech-type complex subunit Ech2C [Thermoanaerobacter kivui]